MADFVITDLLEYAVNEAGFDPKLLVKYVDDLLLIVPVEEIENFLSIINTYDKSIKFTMETEEESKIAYLDMLIHRTHEGKLETSLYQKPTSKNRLLNFNSAHPRSQLIGMAYGTISRILSITSERYFQNSVDTIYDILSMNSFPLGLVRSLISRYTHSKYETSETKGSIVQFKSLIYIPDIAESLKKLFNSYDTNIKLGFKSFSTVRTILNNLHPPIIPLEKHGVIYIFNCNDCAGEYIGQTGQKLKERIKQHIQDSKQKDFTQNQTAVVHHIINTGHSFNYDEVRILLMEYNLNKRLVLESICINKHRETSLNLRSDLDSLNPIYSQLID